jgi:hypothetical protein
MQRRQRKGVHPKNQLDSIWQKMSSTSPLYLKINLMRNQIPAKNYFEQMTNPNFQEALLKIQSIFT